jgi:hypothetical protein
MIPYLPSLTLQGEGGDRGQARPPPHTPFPSRASCLFDQFGPVSPALWAVWRPRSYGRCGGARQGKLGEIPISRTMTRLLSMIRGGKSGPTEVLPAPAFVGKRLQRR